MLAILFSFNNWCLKNSHIRLLVIGVVGLLLCSIFIGDIANISWDRMIESQQVLTMLWLSFTSLMGLLFFSVGALVFLYAKQRTIARLLFTFCFLMSLESSLIVSGAGYKDLFNFIGGIVANCSLPVVIALFLLFPTNIVKLRAHHNLGNKVRIGFLGTMLFFSLINIPYYYFTYILHHPYPIGKMFVTSYFGIGIIGVLLIILSARRLAKTIREKQQLQIVIGGLTLSFVPLFLFTIIPTVFHLPILLAGELSTQFFILLPLSLGYAILRYQILILDTYIRRYVSWMLSFLSIAFVTYLLLILSNVFLSGMPIFFIVSSTLILPLLALVFTSKGQSWTEKLFFSEMVYYRKMAQTLPVQINSSTLIQSTTALKAAFCDTFSTPGASVLIFNRRTKQYVPFLATSSREDIQGQEKSLLVSFFSKIHPSLSDSFSLDASLPCIAQLQAAKRPLFLHEITNPSDTVANLIERSAPDTRSSNQLLIPLRVQGAMVGVLILDERGNHEHYAGPEFEGINLLLEKYVPFFETAWLIEELQTANSRLKSVNKQLSHLDQLKSQFITNASHELRTPLTAVAGYINLLREHPDSFSKQQQAEYLQKATLACDQLIQQVKVISEADQMKSELPTITISPCSLNECITQALEIMQGKVLQEHRNIHVDCPPNITVLASSHHVREVLVNLLSNASKYSNPGTPLDILVRVVKRRVEVAISDQGFGIPSSSKKSLFVHFGRLKRDVGGTIRGSGLGLVMCKQRVEAMHGKIWFKSEGIPGKGSTFYFTLPIVSSPNID